MVELRTEHPFQMPNGSLNEGLIKHWAEDENGKRYLIKQIETGIEYGEAIDIFPCPYTYITTENPDEDNMGDENLPENSNANE